MVQADWDNVDSSIPPGKYKTVIQDAVEKAGKDGGPIAYMKFLIVEGPQADSSQPHWISLKAKALWRFKKLGSLVGLDMKGQKEINISDLNGKAVGILIKEQEYQGSLMSSVTDYYSLEEKEKKESAPAEEKKDESTPFD